MRKQALLLPITLAFVCAACSQEAPGSGVAEMGNTGTVSTLPDAGERVPGSTADEPFCEEHGVAEAVCTKCNPALIAGFKAKGDWCEEHGFAESSCPICHPERGRPRVMDESFEEAPSDGTRVTFKTRETARLAGLRTVAATGGTGGSHLVVTAKLVYDAAKVAHVNTRAAGVVQSVRVDVGTSVRRGSPLAVIESAGVGSDQSRVQASRSRVHVAEELRSRVKELYDEGIVPEMEVIEANRELAEAQAELDSASTSLEMIGGTSEGASRYTLSSPIGGIVTSRQATIGQLMGTGEVLFEVVDGSTMWAEIDIPEAGVSGVAPGQRVTLTVDGLGEREFSGTLTYIAPEIDPHTRTAMGRVSLANPDGVLRANMFASARIAAAGSIASVLVPREAVQRARGSELVFVRLSEQVYEARRVVSSPPESGLVPVAGRISAGDRVVTDGSFLLKTETLKGSIGAGCCDVEKPR